MLCCTDYIDLGCITKCEPIQTGIVSSYTGYVTIKYQWLNTVYSKAINIVINEPIVLPNDFNDSAYIEFQLFDQLGNSLTPNQCFKFNNSIQFNL